MSILPIQAKLVVSITEFPASNKIELLTKNGITIKAYKSNFSDYEQFKRAVLKGNEK